ncbi:MAG: DEAD/DEAH box helicase [Planctomycetes bacterium]|nr:DEAD/DEAH box helicase [Planctomycetota bacterium]
MKPQPPPDPARFEDLGLVEPLLQAIREEGYTAPTPIQARAIPHALAGKDLMGCAQTGTGKTAAFALPILQRLMRVPAPKPRHIRALILSPTRELASQIGESFGAYGRHAGLVHTVVYGGVGQGSQTKAIRAGVDILVATPGRLLDLMGQGFIRLNGVEVLVLDEADRMLDMGFIFDVKRIINAVPLSRQTFFFSATLTHDATDLAREILHEPLRIDVAPSATTVEKVQQWVYFVEKSRKARLLEQILRDPAIVRVLVFTKTKHGANRVAEELNRGPVRADVIHSNRSQSARERSLEHFRSGETRVLVATDIAARGIDVDGITHVVNYDVPHESEVYVHRIGRTARAGAAGVALTLCDRDERGMLRDIENLIRMKIPEVGPHPAGPGAGPSAAPGAAPHVAAPHHAAPHHAAHAPAHAAPHRAVAHPAPPPAPQAPSTRGRLRQRRYNPR